MLTDKIVNYDGVIITALESREIRLIANTSVPWETNEQVKGNGDLKLKARTIYDLATQPPAVCSKEMKCYKGIESPLQHCSREPHYTA